MTRTVPLLALWLAIHSLVAITQAFTTSSLLVSPRAATTVGPLFSDIGDDDGSSPSDTGDFDSSPPKDRFTAGPGKTELLNAIGDGDQVIFGFGDSRSKIPELANSLENKYVQPLDKPSTWKLLYTNAPDLLGIQGGPLSQLLSIEQTLDQTTLTLTLTYKPAEGPIPSLMENFLQGVSEDRLTQTVVFAYEEKSMNVFNLKLQSTTIDSTRFGTLPTVTIPSAAPFVEAFKVDFNDGDLRMERTVQGDFLAIYQRVD
jgi:hypothetical protein